MNRYLPKFAPIVNLLNPKSLKTRLTAAVVLSLAWNTAYSQFSAPAGKVKAVERGRYISRKAFQVQKNDSVVIAGDSSLTGKQLVPYTRQIGKTGYSSYVVKEPVPDIISAGNTPPARSSRLTVHGNILYSVDYRSYIDTPYAEQDVYYHTLQTYWDVVYKNQLPFRVYLTNRFSNSAFTRRFTDVSMNWNTSDFNSKLRQVIQRYPRPSFLADSLKLLEETLERKRYEKLHLQNWLQSAATVQRLVEIEERQLHPERYTMLKDTLPDFAAPDFSIPSRPRMPGTKELPSYLAKLKKQPSGEKPDVSPIPSRTEDSAFLAAYNSNKQKADSLQQQLQRMEQAVRTGQRQLMALRSLQSKGLEQLKTREDLEAEVRQRQIPDSALPAGYRFLWAIKSFGIGRTVVDYSELSAKNVSINGFRMEYNPDWYFAVAAGTIDYRFRDFIVKNATAPPQHLYMIRAGRGAKNGNNVILTWYTGKKQLYNSSGNSQTIQPDYHLMGFTLEGNYKPGDNTLLTAEIAKSSLPYYQGTDKNLLSAAVRFNEHSNEAYSLKGRTEIPATGTKIQAFYKHYGANFQSFSLITTGIRQKAWMIKADQPFFRRKLLVSASLKENDYTGPATTASYQSNIVFKSIQATLRVPRWPVLMLGYYPSAQLTKLDNGEFTENLFYTLVGNLSHYYKVNDLNMTSSALFTRFYNKQADSGFIYSNTTNWQFSQSLFYNRLTCQSTAALSLSRDYNLYTVDNEVQYALLEWLRAGAGIKYNRQTNFDISQTGYKGSVTVSISKLGQLQLMIDKGYIPGANRRLVENNTGRFSFFRIF